MDEIIQMFWKSNETGVYPIFGNGDSQQQMDILVELRQLVWRRLGPTLLLMEHCVTL